VLGLALVLALTQTPQHRLERQPNLPRASKPLFEFAPTNGAGVGTACACTAVTGAKGEAATFARASSGTCLKGSTTAIANGDLVTCSSGQPRVMYGNDGTGALGLLLEEGIRNNALRGRELCNAAWSDVGTPSCVADQATGPYGAQTMDQFTDNDAAAFEGRSQAITTTVATKHSVVCYVKAGTATAASVTMVGTGNGAGDCTGTATGLSTTTSTPVNCTSPAAYTGALTAVTFTVRVGTVVGDTGTLFVEGCQHEENTNAGGFNSRNYTSYVDTAGAIVTRADETISFPAIAAIATAGSAAITVLTTKSVGSALVDLRSAVNNGRALYIANAVNNVGLYDGTNDIQLSTGTLTTTNPKRFASSWSGSSATVYNVTDGTSQAGSFLGFTIDTLSFGSAAWAQTIDGVFKQVCVDTSPTRCR
jgi:hypothetical protein